MARRSVGNTRENRLFVELPGSRGERLLVTKNIVDGDTLKLGPDFVSRTLGRGRQAGEDGIIRVPIRSAREIE